MLKGTSKELKLMVAKLRSASEIQCQVPLHEPLLRTPQTVGPHILYAATYPYQYEPHISITTNSHTILPRWWTL